MISRQCRKNESSSKLTVERALRYLRGDFTPPDEMKYKMISNANDLGSARNASIHASAAAIILLVAAQSVWAQTLRQLPSSSPTHPASDPRVAWLGKVMAAVGDIDAGRVGRGQSRG